MTRIESERYPVTTAGIDWVSVRTSDMDQSNAYDALTHPIFQAAKESGEKVERSARLGFVGRAVNGCFLGHREAQTLCTLSSNVALQHGPTLIRLGGSVARLDLQATIDTGADLPNLASLSFYRAKMLPLTGGRPRELKLTQVHPEGDTLNVNKRTSDTYGRLYDWGVAHGAASKHRYWRYEIELKRTLAKHTARLVAGSDNPAGVAESLVHGWFDARLPDVAFAPSLSSSTLDLMPEKKDRDVLRWFEESLSVCVARAIKDYGRERVMIALGLHKPTQTNKEV